MYLFFFFFFANERFGGSQYSQSQVASATFQKEAASSTDIPDREADSDSEEEDPKDDLDPFSTQGQAETTDSEILYFIVLPLFSLCAVLD